MTLQATLLQYRHWLIWAQDGLGKALLKLKQQGVSQTAYQATCENYLENTVGKQLVAVLNDIQTERNQVSCSQCGACCRLANSRDDWQTLQAKANAGDDFAKEFTSVFLPFASTEAAQAKHPELITDILQYVEGDTIYFYHCPHVQEDNRCGLYGSDKRPNICSTYPETPLTYIAPHCAWKPWQLKHHDQTLKVHATLQVASQLLEKTTL